MRPLLLAAFCLFLGACMTAGKRGGERAMVIYDLGYREIGSEKTAPARPSTAVEVRAPLWFDSLGIHYRLNYDQAVRLREYGQARWAGPPAQMIQQRLVRDLGMVPVGQGRTNCVLRLDVEEFTQVFDTPASSRAVMQVRAQWLDRGRKQIAERRLQIEEADAGPNAQSGVAAQTRNVDRLSNLLQAWITEGQAPHATAACLN